MIEVSDYALRVSFFELLNLKLAHILLRQINPSDLSFTEDEEVIIEYFVREMSPVHVSAHEERRVCVEKFCEDLTKLTEKDQEQLMIFEQAFNSSLYVLNRDLQFHMRLLFNSLREAE